MAQLEFGEFDTFAPDERAGNLADMYDAHLRDAREGERLGYTYYFFIEHQNAGFTCVSSPNVYLAALARETKTLRFGAMVYQLPTHHPIRLAQDTAMVDQISRGRLEFAIGYGTRVAELERWKIPFSERRPMGVEAMDIILKAWTQKNLSYTGQYWSFEGALPQPQPYQQPHPPVWMGGHSPKSFDYAAANNFNVAQNMDVETTIAEKFNYFRHAWKKYDHPGPMPRTLLVRHVHVAETDDQARAEAEQYMLEGLGGQTGVARALSLHPEEKTPEMVEISRIYLESSKSYHFWIDEGIGIVGSPKTVARRIQEMQQLCGFDVFCTHHQITSMPRALARKSFTLFGEQVIPAFK